MPEFLSKYFHPFLELHPCRSFQAFLRWNPRPKPASSASTTARYGFVHFFPLRSCRLYGRSGNKSFRMTEFHAGRWFYLSQWRFCTYLFVRNGSSQTEGSRQHQLPTIYRNWGPCWSVVLPFSMALLSV